MRIDRVTPITPTSLVTLALLGVGDRALTLAEVCTVLRELVGCVRKRGLPTTEALQLDTPDDVRRALGALIDSGVPAFFDEGPETVYLIGPRQAPRRRVSPQHHHPLLRERRDRRAGAGAHRRARLQRRGRPSSSRKRCGCATR